MPYLVIDEDGDCTMVSRALNTDELKMAADATLFIYDFRDGHYFGIEVTEQEPTAEELEEDENAESTFEVDWNMIRSAP